MSNATWEIDGRDVEVTNLERIYFPDDGVLKADVVEYYRRIGPMMLPHLQNRAISMKRYPRGLAGVSFYQKRIPDYFPDWIETVKVETEDGEQIEQVVVCDVPSLVYLANQGMMTPHVWLAKIDAPRRPDRMVFDFDPPEDARSFDNVVFGARRARELLEERGLRSFVMTTGSRGLHVVIPLVPHWDVDAVREFARSLSQELAHAYPDKLTVEHRKAKRGDRVFIDYLRNAYAQTTVAPYAVRGRPRAPVAAPLEWNELGSSDFGPRRWNIENICRRLGQRGDPWEEIDRSQQPLPL